MRRSMGLVGTGLLVALVATGCSVGNGAGSAASHGPAGSATDVRAPVHPGQPDPPRVDPVSVGGQATADDASSSTAAPGAVAKPVPAPVETDLRDVVAVEEQEVLPAVAMDRQVTVKGELSVELTAVNRVMAEAHGPGEIGGDAASVTIRMRNLTDEVQDLTGVTVTAVDDRGVPLVPLLADDSFAPFSGALSPGGDVEGVYLFAVSGVSTTSMTVTVNPAPHLPVAVFDGVLSP